MQPAGRALQDSGIRQQMNIIVLAVKKPAGSMVFNPTSDAVLEAGDPVNLKTLERLA